jgi:rapamycin-insensitive companion of mTOR
VNLNDYSKSRTAYFVIGLLSSTMGGVEILKELGWISVMTTMGTPTGLCIPSDPSKFLSLPSSTENPPLNTSTQNTTDPNISRPSFDPVDLQIIDAITNMISVVHAKEATRSLGKLKQRYPGRFKQKDIWLAMFHCLERWNYPLSVRRFLFEFFGPRGMIKAVGRVEENDGESEDAEDSNGNEEEVARKTVENVGRFDV